MLFRGGCAWSTIECTIVQWTISTLSHLLLRFFNILFKQELKGIGQEAIQLIRSPLPKYICTTSIWSKLGTRSTCQSLPICIMKRTYLTGVVAKNACASKTMKIVMIKNYKWDATEMDSPIAMVFPTPPISEIMSRMNCSIFILIL